MLNAQLNIECTWDLALIDPEIDFKKIIISETNRFITEDREIRGTIPLIYSINFLKLKYH